MNWQTGFFSGTYASDNYISSFAEDLVDYSSYPALLQAMKLKKLLFLKIIGVSVFTSLLCVGIGTTGSSVATIILMIAIFFFGSSFFYLIAYIGKEAGLKYGYHLQTGKVGL